MSDTQLDHLTHKERYERRLARGLGVLDIKPDDFKRERWPATDGVSGYLLSMISELPGWTPSSRANLWEQRAHAETDPVRAGEMRKAAAMLRGEGTP